MNSSINNTALFQRMMEAARSGTNSYIKEYAESLHEIGPYAAASEDRAVRDVWSSNSLDAVDAVKVSLLYNDVSVLGIGVLKGAQVEVFNPSKIGQGTGFRVTVPSDMQDIINAAQTGQLNCGILLPDSESDSQFYSDIAPLIGQGRLVLSPSRLLVYFSGKMTPQGNRVWETHQTSPLAPIDVWTSQDSALQGGPIKTVTNAVLENNISKISGKDLKHELILPYIKDISLAEYAKILEDESDQIDPFRHAIKSYLLQLQQNDTSVEQFRKDVIQPKIDDIERRFRKITNSSNIRMGGLALGAAIMGVTTLATGGVSAALTAIAGTAGLVGGAKELGDRVEKLSGLKDEPLHLLWRLKRRT